MKESSISMTGLHHRQSLLRHFINGRWQKTQVPWSSLRRHKRSSAAKWKHSQWVVDLLTLDSVRPGDRHEVAQPRPVRPLRPSHVTPSCRCDIHLSMATQHSQPPLGDTVALSCRANRHKKTTTRQPTLCCTPTSLEKYVGSPHRRADLLGQMQTFPLLKWMYGGPWEIPLCTPFLQLQCTLSWSCVTGRLGLAFITAHLRAFMLLLLAPCDGGDCVIGGAPGASQLHWWSDKEEVWPPGLVTKLCKILWLLIQLGWCWGF